MCESQFINFNFNFNFNFSFSFSFSFMNEFANSQANPGFFKVHDVARRIAGNGSLGLDRFIVLLDLKASQHSSLAPHLQVKQPL